jgi:hypothetical protein
MDCCGCKEYVNYVPAEFSGLGLNYKLEGSFHDESAHKGTCVSGLSGCEQLSGCFIQGDLRVEVHGPTPMYAWMQQVGTCGSTVKLLTSTGVNTFTGSVYNVNCNEYCGWIVNFHSGDNPSNGVLLQQGALVVGCEPCCQSGQTGCGC